MYILTIYTYSIQLILECLYIHSITFYCGYVSDTLLRVCVESEEQYLNRYRIVVNNKHTDNIFMYHVLCMYVHAYMNAWVNASLRHRLVKHHIFIDIHIYTYYKKIT